jgi:hypothetical protein
MNVIRISKLAKVGVEGSSPFARSRFSANAERYIENKTAATGGFVV